jgi:hypothetical protein
LIKERKMKRDFDFLCSFPVLACFDNEDAGDDGGGGSDGGGGYATDFDDNGDSPGDSHVSTLETRLKEAEEDAMLAREEADRKSAQARQASTEAAQAKDRSFNQDDMNRFLADDRRKHKEKYKKLEGAYQDMLADKDLASNQREKLQGELEDLQKTFRTKKSNEEYERKREQERFKQEVTGHKEAAHKWEHMYKDSAIQRALQDSAIAAEAFNPAQIIGLLRPMTEMRPAVDVDGNELSDQMVPKVDFPDINEETGQAEITLRTPQEAVQRMKELPEQWGNLFRANVVSGIGSGAATGGVTSGEGGRIDVTKLSPEQYRKLRKENPEALGLRR